MTEKLREQKTTLRELLAKDLWYHGTKSRYQWEYLISTRKIAWYKKADSILSLLLKEVEVIENPYEPCTHSHAGFHQALSAVKKILGKV